MSEPDSVNLAVGHHQTHQICGGAFQVEVSVVRAADPCSVFTEKVNAVEVTPEMRTAFCRATAAGEGVCTELLGCRHHC